MYEPVITMGPWNPTPEEKNAYLAREVELARRNLAVLRARGLTPTCSDTLHTIRTYLLA